MKLKEISIKLYKTLEKKDKKLLLIDHDSTLREMATVRPATLGALGRVTGVGTRKLEAYGDAFLHVIKAH